MLLTSFLCRNGSDKENKKKGGRCAESVVDAVIAAVMSSSLGIFIVAGGIDSVIHCL